MIALMMAAALAGQQRPETISCSQAGKVGQAPEVITFDLAGDRLVMQKFRFVVFRVVYNGPDALIATYPSIGKIGSRNSVNARTISIDKSTGDMVVGNVDVAGTDGENSIQVGRCEWVSR